MKKKIFVVFLVIVLIAILSGCSSSAPESTDTKTNGEQADQAGQASQGTQTTTQGTKTTTEGQSEKEEIPREFKYKKGTLPTYMEHVLDNGVPIIVVFYDSDDRISQMLKTNIEQVAELFPREIVYFDFTDDNSDRAAKVSMSLGIGYIPSISIVNKNKQIVFQQNGFIDANYLEHQVFNAIYQDETEKDSK